MTSSSFRSFCHVLAMAATAIVFSAGAIAQEKTPIKLNIHTGDAWTFDRTIDMSMTNKGTANGETKTMESKMVQHRIGKLEVLAVRNGSPTEVKVTFGKDCDTKMEMTGQQSQTMPFPFAGQVITVSRSADGSLHHDFQGKADPMSLSELQSMLELDTTIYTDQAVGVGEEWKGNNEALAKTYQLSGPNDRAGMTLKLLALNNHAGRPSADVKVSAVAMKEMQGVSSQSIMQGTVTVDLATGHVSRGELKSTLTQNGKTKGPGPNGAPAEITIEGTGTTTINLTSELIGAGAAPEKVAINDQPRANLVLPNGNLPVNPAGNQSGNPLARGQNPLAAPARFAGKFSDGSLTLELSKTAGSYTGTITLGKDTFKASAVEKNATLEGSFETGGQTFPFTASRENDTVTFKTGDTTYTLKKAGDNLSGKSGFNDLPVSVPATDSKTPELPQRPTSPVATGTAAGDSSVMRFETYSLKDDPNYLGGEVSRALIPAGWKVEGGMVWDMANTYFPAQLNLRIFDPHSVSALASYPTLYFYWSNNQFTQQLSRPGSKYMGAIVKQPISDPIKAVKELVIPTYRKDLLRARLVEAKELPKVSDKIMETTEKIPGTQYVVKVCKLTFEYELQGQLVQEDFFAALETRVTPQYQFMNWNLTRLGSNRAVKGKMAELEAIQKIVEKSVQPNLEWSDKYAQFVQAAHNIGMDAIHQAGVRSKIIANMSNDISKIRKDQYEHQQAVNDQISEARSQTMRGVTPYDAGNGQRVELPNNYNQAWRDGTGQYIVSNNPNYNPNQDPNNSSNWTEMHPAVPARP